MWLLLTLLVGCAGRAEPDTQPPVETHAADHEASAPLSGEALLTELRARLHAVTHEGPRDQPARAAPMDVSGLVGMSRDVIVAALGAPAQCVLQQRTHCYGEPAFCTAEHVPWPPPCQRDEDVYYAFYRLPEGESGGGQVLLMRYDADARCVLAEFFLAP